MSISMYRISVPAFQQMLTSLDFALQRGAEFAKENGLDEGELMQRRLAPDMFTLAEQVRQACVHACAATSRLAGDELPAVEMEPDTDIPAARARIAAALEYLEGFTPEQLDGDPDRPVNVKTRLAEMTFGALEHLIHFANPQVYFHVTTAHDLLRAEGVQIGKIDFIGQMMKDKVAAANAGS